jgi:hypothetical protein
MGVGSRPLLFRVVGNQSAGFASYEVDTRAGQAPHAFIAALNPYLRQLVLKDVLNVQACYRAPKDEWPYHAELYSGGAAPGLVLDQHGSFVERFSPTARPADRV